MDITEQDVNAAIEAAIEATQEPPQRADEFTVAEYVERCRAERPDLEMNQKRARRLLKSLCEQREDWRGRRLTDGRWVFSQVTP